MWFKNYDYVVANKSQIPMAIKTWETICAYIKTVNIKTVEAETIN
jgi:hypothetical protein